MDVMSRFYERIQTHREPGIHVSNLVYDCIRRGYYEVLYGESFNTLDTLITFWLGHAVHKMPILKYHELGMDWEGIHGTCDEYEDGVLLDKKSTTSDRIPTEANDHHIKQVEYYKVMLEAKGMPVTEAHILYIQLPKPHHIRDIKVPLRQSENIRKELLQKKKVLQIALEKKIPPPRVPGWICSYCNFASICWKPDELNRHGERWVKALDLIGQGHFSSVAVNDEGISAKYTGEDEKEYAVFAEFDGQIFCSCKDFQTRKLMCKHILAMLAENKQVIGEEKYQKLITGAQIAEEETP